MADLYNAIVTYEVEYSPTLSEIARNFEIPSNLRQCRPILKHRQIFQTFAVLIYTTLSYMSVCHLELQYLNTCLLSIALEKEPLEKD